MRCRSKHSGRIERKGGLQAIADAKEAWRKVFASACQHDGIPPDSSFVVFSDDNPFVQFINPAVTEMHERIREYQSGGYVGLVME